jgi:uncharacterized metal-binding protein
MSQSCNCSGTSTLIFSCSGAADVGELADRVSRKLTRDGSGKLYCLAGLGAELDNFIATTKESSRILAIDGCPVDCAKKVLQKNGFTDVEFLRITDLGYVKGKTAVTESIIDAVTTQASDLLKGEKSNAV